MNFSAITLDKLDAIAVITLNRPQVLNAYTVQMGEELVEAFEHVRHDDSIRSVILTGAGRAFCAGVDMKELEAMGQNPDLPTLGEERWVKSYCEELYNFPKPVIAAIKGPAIGIGVTMTLPCDIRLASEGAKLGMPFAKMGIVPSLGSTFLLPRLLGLSKAKMLALTGQPISSSEAMEYGLVDRIAPRSELLGVALEIAEAMNDGKPQIVELIKQAFNQGAASESLEESLRFEQAQNAKRSQ
jgi:enoyl-CoA hydratase/carnithine racemase